MEMTKTVFDREASQALKGIAIVMMLFHHCFQMASRYDGWTILFSPLREQQVINLAVGCKICVAIFAFISGYGLFLGIKNKRDISTIWCIKRYIKTMSGYWFLWITAAVITQITDKRMTRSFFYDGPYRGFIYVLLDFFGVKQLFGTPQLLSFSWYMSAAVVFILITPLVYKARDELWLVLAGSILLLRSLHPGKSGFTGNEAVYTYLSPYLLGAIFARYSLFDRWQRIGAGHIWVRVYRIAVESWLVVVCYKLYQNIPREYFWEFHYGIYPIIFILLCMEFISIVAVLRRRLCFLGKHSMNIWLLHGFFRPYTYAGKHFVVVVILLICVSLTLSIVVERLKKLVKYDKLTECLLKYGIILQDL